MRKVLAIFFLFTLLNATTAFGEILKLPVLIHHYFEHSQEDENASIFNFLVIHYKGAVHQHQNSHNDHEKLPFKTTIGHFSSAVSAVLPSIEFSLTSKVVDDLIIPVYNPQSYSNAFLNSIWQPPRFSKLIFFVCLYRFCHSALISNE